MAENSLIEKIAGLQEKYDSLQKQLSDPEVISDMKKYVQLNKEYKELSPIIEAGKEYRKMVDDYDSAKEILAGEKDEELREMAKDEISAIEEKIPGMEENIKLLLREVPHLNELNIGHSIICRAVFTGIENAVAEMLGLMSSYQG